MCLSTAKKDVIRIMSIANLMCGNFKKLEACYGSLEGEYVEEVQEDLRNELFRLEEYVRRLRDDMKKD